jgi:hypothetical protein
VAPVFTINPFVATPWRFSRSGERRTVYEVASSLGASKPVPKRSAFQARPSADVDSGSRIEPAAPTAFRVVVVV